MATASNNSRPAHPRAGAEIGGIHTIKPTPRQTPSHTIAAAITITSATPFLIFTLSDLPGAAHHSPTHLAPTTPPPALRRRCIATSTTTP